MTNSGLAYSVSLVEYVSSQRIQAYLEIPAMTVLIYDFFLTLDDEVEYIWKRTKTISSYLFFVQRVLAVLSLMPSASSVISMGSYFDTGLVMCGRGGPSFNLLGNVLLFLSEFLVGVYLLLRIWALYEKSLRVMMSGVVWCICYISTLVVVIIGKSAKGGLTGGGCDTGSAPSTSHKTAVTWGLLILNETIIFVLIMYKMTEARRQSSLPNFRPLGNRRISLEELIVRDGAMYYMVVILVSVANMSSYFVRILLL
ncbi:hypothetical protein JR316_0006303 [Psilocybe cubensis]|uniref:Uncharacterized protein n=1 Tax=Psilocybe cubensis TaxID=181762 RepID=A0ACB8H1M7_PSICU|nr:hypothetical protein JR316_0006303 [Psilocybe cubensis]KAH9481776.1 hypothetical protein JR316_0006303 [Psilocybe cubensis]